MKEDIQRGTKRLGKGSKVKTVIEDKLMDMQRDIEGLIYPIWI